MKSGLVLPVFLAAIPSDYLSRLLQRGELGWGVLSIGMVVAFAMGAVHALSPGHGKTIVAAYLVGTRGTVKHAAFLGLMVTFTHTITVFFLGFVTLFLSRYVLPERIYPVLGAASGLAIAWIGVSLFWKRLRAARGVVANVEGDYAAAAIGTIFFPAFPCFAAFTVSKPSSNDAVT